MTPTLQDLVITRLAASGAESEPWGLHIVAAMEGPAELDAYLDNTSVKPTIPKASDSPTPGGPKTEPPGVYVSSIKVEGFRGIGDAVTLAIPPGPGLVLVVGRNGSGKSSFAEGLELLLTGRNFRWDNRTKVWREGWRNLHQSTNVSLKADLHVEGQGTMTASRVWKTAELSASEATIVRKGSPAQPLESLGWHEPLGTFRPFLSYNELGSLLDEGPAKLYDALSSVLGLEELVLVQTTLSDARKVRQQRVDEAKKEGVALVSLIENAAASSSDTRLSEATRALKWPWDLAKLRSLATGDAKDQDDELRVLSQILNLPRPNLEAIASVIAGLRAAERACDGFAGTDAERSRERANLLSDALRFHAKHKGSDCPVCGTTEALSVEWHEKTEKEVAALRREAEACDAAEASRRARIREALQFVTTPPPCLTQATLLGLPSLVETRRLWMVWAGGRDLTSATALADHLETHVQALHESIEALIEDARVEGERRQDVWAPIALAIAQWLPKAKLAPVANAQIAELKAAEGWWKGTSGAIRDERFAPVSERAMAIWKQLRLQSNVDLGSIELAGAGTQRRVSLTVSVDGAPAEALGVMSQGELHALALSLFLPRATLPESPFRFVWIDDPVQSMDPARVEGLARVLAETAKTRQVVVFTHDDRLPEAVRRLGIAATAFAVARRADSIVEVRPMTDPVSEPLANARALAKTTELPRDVVSRVIPGLCRTAIEAACTDTIRRRRLGRGQRHDEVEQLLLANTKTSPLMALALFDDGQRTSDVLTRLNRMGQWSGDAFQAVKTGAHTSYAGDFADLIKDSERLAQSIQSMPS